MSPYDKELWVMSTHRKINANDFRHFKDLELEIALLPRLHHQGSYFINSKLQCNCKNMIQGGLLKEESVDNFVSCVASMWVDQGDSRSSFNSTCTYHQYHMHAMHKHSIQITCDQDFISNHSELMLQQLGRQKKIDDLKLLETVISLSHFY